MHFKYPVLQVALDFTDLDVALKVADIAWEGGVTWLEIGTPLIKCEGVKVIRIFRERFSEDVLIADMKCMDAGDIEVSLAANAGADIVTVLGVAHNTTIIQALRSAKKLDVMIMVDLINISNPVRRAMEVERLGAHFVCLHTGIDVQRCKSSTVAEEFLDALIKLKALIKLPVAVAGGVNLFNARRMIDAGAQILIVGSAITKSDNPKFMVKKFLELL